MDEKDDVKTCVDLPMKLRQINIFLSLFWGSAVSAKNKNLPEKKLRSKNKSWHKKVEKEGGKKSEDVFFFREMGCCRIFVLVT